MIFSSVCNIEIRIRFSDPNFAFYVKWCVINEEYQLGYLGKLNACVYVTNQKNDI